MVWNTNMTSILARSQRYLDETWNQHFLISRDWDRLVRRSAEGWEKIVNRHSVNSEELDEWEKIELGLFQDDDNFPGNLEDVFDWEFNNEQNLEWARV